MDKATEQLKTILESNPDLNQRMQNENWDIRYRKSSDMVVMGAEFPADTSYFDVKGTGVLIRIDDSNRIHGFAIENFKHFAKNNPEFQPFYFITAHPIRARIIFMVARGLHKMNMSKVVSEFVAGQAVYAR